MSTETDQPLPLTTPDQAAASRLSRLVALHERVTVAVNRFAHLEPGELDEAVDRSLEEIGSFIGVDRAYRFVFSDQGTKISNTHEWCAPGIRPEIDKIQGAPADLIAWWLPRLAAGDPVIISDVQALDGPRATERKVLADQDIVSLLAVPLASGDRLLGFVGFDSVRGQRSWSLEELALLRTLADVMASAQSRLEAERAARQAQVRLSAIMRHSSELCLICDGDGRVMWASPSTTELLGYDTAEVVGRSGLGFVHPEDVPLLAARLEALRDQTRGEDGIQLPDHRMRHADGSYRWMETQVSDLRDEPAIEGFVLTGHDITAHRASAEALEHSALHDPLTGLANRGLLLDRLERARRQADGYGPAVLFCDIDDFKMVNDSLGHATGDRVLIEVAARLSELGGPGDTVARFSADEFVLVIESITDRADAEAFAERVVDTLRAPFTLHGQPHHLTASIGVVLGEPGHQNAGDLLRDADMALFAAKRGGRNQATIHDAPLREQLLRRIELVTHLPTAATENHLSLVHQPIVELIDGRMSGTEALLRWGHPTQGPISPNEFIPLAEEVGEIGSLGTWALERALADLAAWGEAHSRLGALTVAVNLSSHQLDDRLPGLVAAALERHSIDSERLQLELTETALVSDPERATRVLGELRAIGVQIAIDDFGTGYSSLAYLRDLPVDALKIDRSFVVAAAHDGRSAELLAGVVQLARTIGATTVAEGVETSAQLAVVTAVGCERAQGFGLQRPIAAERIPELFERTAEASGSDAPLLGPRRS